VFPLDVVFVDLIADVGGTILLEQQLLPDRVPGEGVMGKPSLHKLVVLKPELLHDVRRKVRSGMLLLPGHVTFQAAVDIGFAKTDLLTWSTTREPQRHQTSRRMVIP
jgi:hypothetical protein